MKKFQPSHTGRPRGTRNKLTGDFLRDLLAAWESDGQAALRLMVKEEPTKFVQVVASLMPREVSMDLAGPLGELSDQELADILEVVRQARAKLIEPQPVLIEASHAED
jgi:hypothetical protein